jgi:beta-N-acetylhexosaminidase
MDLASTCGQLVVGGFPGTSLPGSHARALRDGRLGGVILFKPNVEGGVLQVAALARELHACTDVVPLIGIDQEGGRVARMKAPLLEVPPMRTVASWNDLELAEQIAHAAGSELGAMGFTIDFAPVLDVNTCADNPVIGDRAFSDDAEVCARFGAAWIRGLEGSGILACGKHFPGHGDTSRDSHIDLPIVDQPLDRIERVELAPFRAAVAAGVASLMTAHVVYRALDPRQPATLSAAVCTELRNRVGFDGVLVSDDLEMQAIAARLPVEQAAVLAVAAGCDALLVCWSQDKQVRAVDALVREAERSVTFRSRCEQAHRRVLTARRRVRARPLGDPEIAAIVRGPESQRVAAEIARRLAT